MTTFDITGTGGFSARVELQEQVDADHNLSILEAKLYILSSRWLGVTYWLQGQINGRDFSSNYDNVYIQELNQPAQVKPSWTFQVAHEADGTAAVTVAVSLRGYTADGGYGNGWKIEGSKTFSLTPIAQASNLTATDGEAGGICTIAISRKNAAYSHQLQYRFGDLSGYITDGGGCSTEPVICTAATISWQLPADFSQGLTHSATAACTITCTTMDGERQVGQPVEVSITVTAPLSWSPLLDPEILDLNPDTYGLTGDQKTVVRGASKVFCNADAQALQGALLEEVTANGAALPAVLDGAAAYVFKVTDSRGYSTEKTVNPRFIDYFTPTVGGACTRVDPKSGSAELTVHGNCFCGSFGVADNSLTVTATLDGIEMEVQPQFDGQSFRGSLRLEGLSYERSYTVTVTARDALHTASVTLNIEPGQPVFDWGSRDFAFHVPVTAPRINGIKNPALKAWPVGAVMIVEHDPAPHIGGKWAHFTLPGIDLDAWRRIQGADVLGMAVLGQLVLGTEE